jgi:hypothetical protein
MPENWTTLLNQELVRLSGHSGYEAVKDSAQERLAGHLTKFEKISDTCERLLLRAEECRAIADVSVSTEVKRTYEGMARAFERMASSGKIHDAS